MSYKVIARKWRPQSLDGLVGQDHISKSLKNSLLSKRFAHAYLFSGPRGVGKTSAARILAKSLSCEKGISDTPCQECSNCIEITSGLSYDVLEIDGASNRGIDQIRELRDSVRYLPSKSRYKIFIIDEVHMLTDPAFNALLKTLEEPPEHVIFIFATTEAHKVKVTIRSRCQHYHFKHISTDLIQKHIKAVALAEGITIEQRALFQVAKAGGGSMRDSQGLLDQLIAYCGDKVSVKEVEEILDIVSDKYYIDFISLLVKQDVIGLLGLLSSIKDSGKDLLVYSSGLVNYFRDLFILKKTNRTDSSLLDISSEGIEVLSGYTKYFTDKQLVDIINLLINLSQELKKAINQEYLFESYLFRLINYEDFVHPSTVIEKLEALEKRLSVASPSLEIKEANNSEKVVYNKGLEGDKSDKIAIDKDYREGFISAVKEKKIFLSTYLEQAELTIDKDKLLISFKEPLYYEEVIKKENISSLEDIFNTRFQKDITIRVLLKESDIIGSSSDSRESMISSVIDSFKGEVIKDD